MVEEQRARIDDAMTKMVEEIEKSHMRHLQAEMFRCAANCCEDKNSSMKSTQRCVDTCGLPLQKAQKYVQDEFSHLQDRLQRCIMSCNDSIRDKMGSKASDADVSRYTREFESCATKCVDSHITLIPSTMKKMKEFLTKKEFTH